MNRTFFTIKFIFIAICYCSFAWCQDNTASKNVITKLTSFLADRPTEKAYLQFDKPYYAAGDTIYFKAYVTEGEQHRPSGLSGVLHVDLVNTKDKTGQSIKLQLDSGVAWGDFALPDSLPPGNYRVRAYTQWMRNEGEGAFFYQTITIASIANNKIPESIARHPVQALDNKADVQFFPEGGNLVSGVQSKVAFKAMGPDGLGVNVKGVVMDSGNKEVCTFSSVHLGMGYFYLEPQEGKTYKAQLTYANGEQSTIDLPKPDLKGIVLSINNDSIPKASVKIAASAAYYQENRKKDFTLLIYSGGIATTVTCKLDSPIITMDILKRRLHTGIATVTLFSPTGEPLCERLLFIQNYDQLNLGVSSDKKTYAKRGKVNINLNAINRAGGAAEGHFSVSVTDESEVPMDEHAENTIISNLLLTSDLKGYVEQPNYYFNDTSADARKNLDGLMLTQGYRRFEWKQVLDNNYPPIAFQPEKALEISGMVKNLFGKPISKGTITLLPSKGGPLLSSVSDDKGMFHFSNLVFNDTTHFVLSAVNAKNKNSTKITYFTDKPAPVLAANQFQNVQTVPDTAMAAFVANDKLQQLELLKYGRAKGIMLKEVEIKNKKFDDNYRTQSLAGAGFADQVMHADEIERIQGQLSTSLNGRLRGIKFINGTPVLTQFSAFNMHPMLVIVDGAMINFSNDPKSPPPDIDILNTNSIETVEVLKYASTSIYGMDGANGVLIITTKQGGGTNIKDIASIGILPIAPMGFYKAREFYSPKYDNTPLVTKQRDFRSTIYWNPEIKTDNDGNASFEYYNADSTGAYRVVVEGIDNKGNIGRQVYRYKVE
jgi:TonB-dependent SusC/RagA subfamily outer membrane receptor